MDYKKELLEMIQKMENIRFLAMAYGFVGRLYQKEKEVEIYGFQDGYKGLIYGNYEVLTEVDSERPDYPKAVFEGAEIEMKYDGYIKRQKADIEEMRRLEQKVLPKDVNYHELVGLRKEAQEKLQQVKPANIGQASRISGVSPADISVLLIWLSKL